MLQSEQEIIRLCRKNDTKAQAALFGKYSGAMMGICLRYSKNKEDARDLLHEGFIKVFGSIARFKGESDIKTWMSAVFVNTAISYIRKHFGRTFYMGEDFPETRQQETEEEDELQHFLFNDLSQNDVLEMVQNLPEKYRVVVNLYCIDGFTHKEISAMLNISEGTSKAQLSRARKLLATMLIKKKVIYEKAS
ncbi:MAG: sigma-70 family RNA polymerase sigma factor [Sphingobacteriales bacterium]|nr:MAG: sigma-70 family RNA polymerase sigma factor [Sphingobacteriales bacterium]